MRFSNESFQCRLRALQWLENTLISNMLDRLLEEFRCACGNMLRVVYFISNQLGLASRNGCYLHSFLLIGQGREIQTQVATWGTLETNYDAATQLKSASVQSRHSQDFLTTVRSKPFFFNVCRTLIDSHFYSDTLPYIAAHNSLYSSPLKTRIICATEMW